MTNTQTLTRVSCALDAAGIAHTVEDYIGAVCVPMDGDRVLWTGSEGWWYGTYTNADGADLGQIEWSGDDDTDDDSADAFVAWMVATRG